MFLTIHASSEHRTGKAVDSYENLLNNNVICTVIYGQYTYVAATEHKCLISNILKLQRCYSHNVGRFEYVNYDRYYFETIKI